MKELKENKMKEGTHIFERDDLGKAPFKVVGIWTMPSRSLMEHNPEAWNNAIRSAPCAVGSCAYCWTALSIHYIIRDAKGKQFAVGSECVRKTGDAGLVKAATVLKNKRAREISAEKREKKRVAKLQAERDKNGGLTNYELQEKKWEDEKKAKLEALKPFIKILSPYANRIKDGKGGFCDSIASSLRQGKLPRGKGLGITIDILSKQSGRRNSKAYNEEYDSLATLFEKISNKEI